VTTPRPGSRAEQRRRTEARILDAATQIFFSAGYDRTTIRAVASAAGVDAGRARCVPGGAVNRR
jgi:AcrR family transcriptional regulator